MRNSVKAGIISTAIAAMPLNVNGNGFGNSQDNLKNQVNTELSTTLSKANSLESMKLSIPPKVITKAMLDYFDEEVKMYKLTPNARTQITSILNSYFSSHGVFDIDGNGRMKFVIDNKKEFALMVKKVLNIVIEDMPFFVRKVVIPLFLGGNDEIQRKLDNLDATMMNMNEKQYKSMVLDYIAGIVRRVEANVNGKFTVGEYYKDISSYYPNKNGKHIWNELNSSSQSDLDIKNYKYKK